MLISALCLALGLVPAGLRATEVNVETITRRTETVALEDGARLATYVLLPAGTGPFPTLYRVTPYGAQRRLERTMPFVEAGYAVVYQDVRGQGASTGEPSPFLDELPDLMASLDWILAQPWCDGRIGLFGSSSGSYSAQILAATGHPSIRAVLNLSGLTDPGELFFPGGAFRLNTLYPWLQAFYLRRGIRDRAEWQERFLALPLSSGFEWRDGLLEEMAKGRVDTGKIQAPFFHVTGWNDVVYRQTLLLHRELARRGVPQRLIVGPWMHNYIGSEQTAFGDEDFGPASLLTNETLHEHFIAWFDRHVKEDRAEALEAPARVFIMGRNEWLDLQEWPPRQRREVTHYLSSNRARDGDSGELVLEPPVTASVALSYDPMSPVPTFGGVNSHLFPDEAGPRDQSEFAARPDVLVFSTPPLESPVVLAGPQKAKILVSSSAPNADIVAKIVTTRPDGYSRIIEDGVRRARGRLSGGDAWLTPNEPVEFEIDLGETAIEIPAGHRIGVHIASSNFPKYDRNPSSTEDPLATTALLPAQHTIHLGGPTGSRVTLSFLD